MGVGIIAVPEGIPFTEIDALDVLFDVEVYPIAAGGVNGAEGSVSLFIEGEYPWVASSGIVGIQSLKIWLTMI